MKLLNLIHKKQKDPTQNIPLANDIFLKHHDSVEDPSKPSFQDIYEIHQQDKIDGLSNTYKCLHKETGTKRSVKLFKRATKEENFWKELAALKSISCPGVPDVYESFSNQKYLYLVFDSMDLVHPLQDAIELSEERVSYIHVAKMLVNLLEILTYLHKHQVDKDEFVAISHGNISDKTFLVEKVGDPSMVDPRELLGWTMLVNYEMATIRPINKDGSYGENVGDETLTMYDDTDGSGLFDDIWTGSDTAFKVKKSMYYPPEYFLNGATPKGDIFSCGVLAYYLLTGNYPYKIQLGPGITEDGPHTEVDLSLIQTPALKQFLEDALQIRPEKRPSAPEALASLREVIQNQFTEKVLVDGLVTGEALKRLKKDGKMHKLQEAVRFWMATTYVNSDEEEYEELLRAFQTIDQNGDQVLSNEEVGQAFEMIDIYLSKKELEATMNQMDLDKNGKVEMNEFVTAAVDWKTLRSIQKLRVAFNEFDVSQTNYITANDLKEVFQRSSSTNDQFITKEAAQAMIDKADTNGDGKLSFEEFYAMMWSNEVKKNKKPPKKIQEDKETKEKPKMDTTAITQKVNTQSDWQEDVDAILRFEQQRFKEGYGWGGLGGIFG